MWLTMLFTRRDSMERVAKRLHSAGVLDDKIEVTDGPRPRLSVKVPFPELVGMMALLGAIDGADPEGRADLWGTPPATSRHEAVGPTPVPIAHRSTFAIHWEPLDHSSAGGDDRADGRVHVPPDQVS